MWRRVARPASALVALLVAGALGAPVSAQGVDAPADLQPSAMQVVSWECVGSGLEAVVAVPAVLSARVLSDASFAVEAGAQPVPFTTRHVAADQLDVALVVTADPTTIGQPEGDAVRAAMVEFVAGLAPGSRVTVVADDPPRALTTFTADLASWGPAFAVQGTKPASIDAALHAATEALVGARRPVVLMVGPGLPIAGDVPTWWPAAVALYGARVEAAERSVGELSRNRTGGFSATRKPAAIVSALDEIGVDLAAQYRITVPDVPAGAARVVIRVRSAEIDSQATVVLAPATAEIDPAGAVASDSLPASPPAVPVAAATSTPPTSGPPWAAVAGAALVLALLVSAVVYGRRRSRTSTSQATTSHASTSHACTSHGSTAEVTIVLGEARGGDAARAHAAGAAARVSSPTDALREVIRRHATTLVIEPGTTDPWPLVRAVANHDRASGRHTRVVQHTANGVLIDLSPGDPEA